MKRFLLTLLILSSFPLSAYAAIALDSSAEYNVSTPASSDTESITLGAGVTALLFLNHSFDTVSSTTPPTYNGQAMTFAQSNNTNSRNYIWYMCNPPTGTHNGVMTWTTSGRELWSYVALTGTATSNCIGPNFINSSGLTGDISDTITSTQNNSWIVDSFYYDFAQTMTAGANQTNTHQVAQSGSNLTGGFSTLVATSTGTQTLSWTHSTNNSDHNHTAVEVLPPSSAPVTTSPGTVICVDLHCFTI